MKKFIVLLLAFCILQQCAVPVYCDVWKGHAEVTDVQSNQGQDEIFTGKTDKIQQKETVKMVVSQVLQGGTTEEGDEFFAEVSADVKGKGGVLLPVGTMAHGIVRNIADPKRGSRDGWIEVKFDYLLTPDGREIPIDASMTTKNTPQKAAAKAVGVSSAYTVTGSLVGGVTALQLFGLESAIASHGYTILGGLAAGAVMGLGMSIIRKGKDVLISRGDEIKVVIQSEMELPVIHEDAFKQEEVFFDGLDVIISDIWLVKDPFGVRNTFELTLDIVNKSQSNFSAFDITVENDLKKKFYPSLFYKDAISFAQLKANSDIKGKLYFAVDDPKRKHWLVFYDRISRKPVARISLDNAKQNLDVNFDAKKKKIKKDKKKK